MIRWSEVHGRVPSAYSDNPDERRLNRSWKAVRKQHPALSAKGRERFDSVQARYRRLQSSTKRPGLSDPERQDLDLQLEKLKAWCAEHGHLPRGGRILDEPAGRAKERRLAHWMSHRISPRQGKSPTAHRQRIRAEILALKAQYPSYRAYRKAKEAERSARDRAGLQVLSGTLRGTEEGPASRQAPQADD